jgi:tetratricopeptide (TPR) repeat protein
MYADELKNNNKDPKIFNNLAINQKNQGKLNESLDSYKKALELDPDNSNFLYNTGLLFAKRSEYKDAQNCLQKALELNPQNPYAYLGLADAHEKQDKLEEALEIYKSLQKLTNSIHGLKEKITYLESIIRFNKEKLDEEQRQKAMEAQKKEADEKHLEDLQKAEEERKAQKLKKQQELEQEEQRKIKKWRLRNYKKKRPKSRKKLKQKTEINRGRKAET